MTKKEQYQEALNSHVIIERAAWFDYFSNEEMKNLKKHYSRENAQPLPGANRRAVIRPIPGGYILESYFTDVMAVVDGKIFKLWEGYSHTTQKHINIFCALFGLPGFSKRDWIMMPTFRGILTDANTGEILIEN